MADTRSTGPKVVAVLLGIFSLAYLSLAVEAVENDRLWATLAFATALLGAGTAIGLVQRRRWFFHTYIAWIVVLVAANTVADARVEPVLWKVISGILISAILPVLGAFYLASIARRAA